MTPENNVTKVSKAPVVNIRQLEPETEVVTRGQKLTLCYDLDAVARVFEITGLNIMAGELTVAEMLKPTVLRATILAGLQRYHPEMTLELIGKLIDMGNLRYWFDRIKTAMQVVSPDEVLELQSMVEGEADPAPLPSSGSGSPSEA
jgi:hypothetical protein